MVLLNEDITKMSADKIPNAKVLVTVLQGSSVSQGEIKSHLIKLLQVNEYIPVDLNTMSKYRLDIHSYKG